MTNRTGERAHNGASGLARRLLKLLVEIDSSRFISKRVAAALGLLCLLGAFAAAGYWLPALALRYFPQ